MTMIGHHPVPHQRPLRHVQRNGTDRSVLSRQHEAPPEPGREPHLEPRQHIAAVTQLRHDTDGGIYYDNKIAEGKTPREAIMAPNRRISDAIYKSLIADTRRTLIT